jgi:hypothetical protein
VTVNADPARLNHLLRLSTRSDTGVCQDFLKAFLPVLIVD